MATVTKYLNTASFEKIETDQYGTISETDWVDLTHLLASDNLDAASTMVASHSGTESKPGRIRATNFGFSFKDNAKINSISAQWEEYIRNPSGGVTGIPNIPSKYVKLLHANGGADTGYKIESADVTTNRTMRTLLFPLSSMPNCKPVNIESSAFGIYLNPQRNTASNPGYMYLDYIRAIVDYTDPTYHLAATISTSKILGEQVVYTLTITNTNNCHQGVAIPISITLPSGLTYASQSGNGTYSTSTGNWNAVLNSSKVATLTLVLNTTSVGTKKVSASIDGFTTTISKSTTVLTPTYTLTSPTSHTVTETQDLSYEITVTVNSTAITSVPVTIPIPAGMTYVSSSGNGTYNSSTHIWTATFVNKTTTLTFILHAVTSGIVTQTITGGSKTVVKTITIMSATVTVPYSSDYNLPTEVLKYLKNGEQYTMSCYSIIEDTILTVPYPGEKNNKFAIINGTEYLSDRVPTFNVAGRISTTFTYDSSQPIILRIYGQYLEIAPANSTMKVGGFALYPGVLTDYSKPAIMFDYPDNLIVNGDMAVVNLVTDNEGATVLFDRINFAGRENDPNLIIKGIKITGDIISPNNVSVTCFLTSTSIMGEVKNTHSKSIISLAEDDTFSLGDETDKWGFNLIDLADLFFVFQLNNIGVNTIDVGIKNVEIAIYYQQDETNGNPGFTLDGVHSREYNIFLSPGWEKPEGLSTDIVTLKLERTDGEKLLSSTVKSKSDKLIFQIVADNFEDANAKLIEITKWLTNARDEYQVPILKALVFDWDPKRTYNVILDDNIDVKLDITKYECTTNFMIPEGVGWDVPKISGAVGFNGGLIPIRPVIQILCDGSSEVVIHENFSGQLLRISNTYEAGTVLIIDCNQRTIIDSSGNSQIDHIGLDSSWFKIARDYDFSDGTGCTIQLVTYREAV